MRMKQGSGLGSLGDFGDGVTERGERVRSRGIYWCHVPGT